jgi:PAS domain S-box-containing protein
MPSSPSSPPHTLDRHPLLQAVVEATAVAIFVKDRDGRYTLVNRHTASLWRMEEAEILGKTDLELFPEEVAAGLRVNDRRVLEAGETVETEETVEFGGERRIYFSSKVPLRGEDGAIFGLCGVAFDITHLRDAERTLQESEARFREMARELAEADHRKDEFLAMLGHELRNPMAPLRHVMELFRARIGDLDDDLRHGVAVAERQLDQMRRLVDDLLDVARLTRGQVRLDRKPMALAPAVEAAVETVRPEAERRGTRIEVSPPGAEVRVDGDEARLTQVLADLLHNAVKYTPDGGRIAVSTSTSSEADGRWVTVEVRDEGIGMEPEVLSRAFEIFYQGEPTLERTEGGLGVGLTLARRLVDLHGGEVTAESASHGEGSLLRVRLPRLPAASEPDGADVEPASAPLPVEAPAEAPAAEAGGTGRRVLIVDDNRDSADSLGTLLELNGHRVEIVYDGESGLEAAERFGPEVVLLDIGLPRLDGYEVARRLRRAHDDLLIVAITGYGQESARERAAEAGFDLHMLKPVDLAALRELLAGEAQASGDQPRV